MNVWHRSNRFKNPASGHVTARVVVLWLFQRDRMDYVYFLPLRREKHLCCRPEISACERFCPNRLAKKFFLIVTRLKIALK